MIARCNACGQQVDSKEDVATLWQCPLCDSPWCGDECCGYYAEWHETANKKEPVK